MGEPIFLTSGAYQSRNVNANAQRAVNLIVEALPKETAPPAPAQHFPRPGKTYLGDPTVGNAGDVGRARGLYTASNGDLYAVVGLRVYLIDQAWQYHPLGDIADGVNPVSMADNGTSGNQLALVDGTATGYQINLTTYAFAPIVDGTGLFTGADIVQYLSTFFIFNTIPNTQNFIISQQNSLTFDALDVAAKSTYPDNISTIGIRQREVWLFGIQTTEPWNLAGNVDFPFDAIAATFVSWGILAKYSMVFADDSLFWISRNTQGQAIILKTEGYTGKRISTHPIETLLQSYEQLGITITDAVGTTYQVQGHTLIQWSFPAANLTLVYDLSSQQWSQFAYVDENGNLNRDRVVFAVQAYGKTVGLDWETGTLVWINPDQYTDQTARNSVTEEVTEADIVCIRGFPHILQGLDRLTINALRVNMECGTLEDPNAEMPLITLRISKNAGHSFNTVRTQQLGATGDYRNTVLFTRLGQARDWVLELMWNARMKTTLLAAYLIDPEKSET